MSNFDALFQSAGQQYGVDPMMLKAIATQESSLNPSAVNKESGASGLMGFTPDTAKAYGIDPNDPAQAIPAAAKMFSENMQRFGGNVEQAVAAHFAGPNQKLWGPKTNQYVGNVASKYAAIRQSGGYAPVPQAQASSAPASSAQPDDIDAMLAARAQGKSVGAAATTPSAPAASDPIDVMLAQRAAGQQIAGETRPSIAKASASSVSPDAEALDLAAGGASSNTLDQLRQIGAGAAHGVGSMFNNAANFVERQAARVGIFPQAAAADTAAQAQADQQFAQTASPGEKASAFVAPMLIPMSGAMAPGNAARAALAARLGGGTLARAVGAGVGNAINGGIMATGAPIDPNQPTGPQDARNVAMGAGIGVTLPAVAAAGKAIGSNIWNAVKPIVNPEAYVGQGLAGAVGDQAANVAQNIRSAPQFVPGSMPTTAQAGANPVLVATEKAAANANPDLRNALAQRAIENNDARWQALAGVAGDQASLDAATKARSVAAQPLYDAAHQATTNVGPAFMRYAQIPEMQQAMERANQLASLDAAVGRGVAPIWPQEGGSRAINGAALDYTSRALGDMIDEAQRAGANSKAASLAALKGKIDSWTQTYIPGVQQARAAYAAGSVPVNTMEVGQQIANGLGTRAMNPGGAPEIQLMPYRAALTKALNSGPAAEFGVDSSALDTLQGIGQDLQRATISNSLRSPGSDTAYNLAAQGWLARQLYGPTFGGAGNLGKAVGAVGATALGHPMIGLGILGGGNKIGQMVGGRLNDQLSNFLLEPNALLPYLDARAAGPVNASQQALAAALRRQILPAAVVGVSRRSLVNAP